MTTSKFNFTFALAILTMLIPFRTNASLKEMQNTYKNAQSVTADFTQKQKNLALGTAKESSGRISIKRPGKFRWETLKPDPNTLVSDGKKVWFYAPPFRAGEHAQLIISKAADVQSQLAIDLLSGHANLSKSFKIQEISPEHYALTPLKPAGDIARIELFLERPTNLVYKLVLSTKTGNQTELTLSNVTLGPPAKELPNSMFTFVPPPNVPVDVEKAN